MNDRSSERGGKEREIGAEEREVKRKKKKRKEDTDLAGEE